MLGIQSINLLKLQRILNVELNVFGNRIKIYGKSKNVKKTETVLNKVYDLIHNDEYENLNHGFSLFETELNMLENDVDSKNLIIKTWKRSIIPKTKGQKDYLNALSEFDLVFGLGPAGTGKSYLAVAKGVELLKSNQVEKIVLSRPAVEAGENLGFLPGDMKDKVDPYLRPIYDALYEMMPFDKVEKKILNGEIEIAPLAFMRGRTFQNSFVIIDEAQNTTPIQMKMILTRIGEGSKMVVNGDLSQVDIPNGIESGLSTAIKTLRDIKFIKLIKLSEKDVIRHPIVAEIIKAYDKKR